MTHHITKPLSDRAQEYVAKMQADLAKAEAMEKEKAEADLAKLESLSAWVQSPEPDREWTPGTRRLRDLPRHVSRPLECQQYALSRKHGVSRMEVSHRLDLHPDDLEALAATAGQI